MRPWKDLELADDSAVRSATVEDRVRMLESLHRNQRISSIPLLLLCGYVDPLTFRPIHHAFYISLHALLV